MENSPVVPQNIKNRITPWSSNSTSASIPRRIESRISNIFGHSLFTTAKKCSQMMNEETEWGLHSGISLSLKKGWRTDTGYSLDESWEYYAEWNKPVTKAQILYDPIVWCSGITETESKLVVARGWERGDGELVFNGPRISAGEDEKYCRDGWKWWLYNHVNVLDATEPYT